MSEPADWSFVAELAPRVRSAFQPERLSTYDATTHSRILAAFRLAPSLTGPRTVDLDQEVLESVFGSFEPAHAFNAFAPDWGIRLFERQATQGLKSLLNRGEARLRAARIRAFLEALKVPNLPNNTTLERAVVLSEKDRIDLEIQFPSVTDGVAGLELVMVEAKFGHHFTKGQLKAYYEARKEQRFVKIHCRIVGLSPEAGRGWKGRQVPLWPVLLWRDIWLQLEKRRPKETDAQLATFMAWLWHRIGGLSLAP